MSEWKRGQFTLAVGHVFANRKRVKTGERTVDGFICGPFGIDKRNGMDWVATHLPTGFVLAGGFPSKAMAQQFCQEIAGFTDWETLGVPTLTGVPPAFKGAYYDAAERARCGEAPGRTPAGSTP